MGKRSLHKPNAEPAKRQRLSSDLEEEFDDNEDLMARAMDMNEDPQSTENSEADDDETKSGEQLETNEVGVEQDEGGPKALRHASDNVKKPTQAAQLQSLPHAQKPSQSAPNMQTLADLHIKSLQVPTPASSKATSLNLILDQLKQLLLKAPPIEPASLPLAIKSLKRTATSIPFPDPQPDSAVQWKLSFEPPKAVNVVGDWTLGMAMKSASAPWVVQVLVQMPATLFQEKDIKDFRYFHKRAFYVAAVAAAIKRSGLPVELHYQHLGNDERRPCLQLSSRQDGSIHDFSSRNCVIHVIPYYVLEESPFALHKLQPNRNNIRSLADSRDTLPDQAPTPAYNASLLDDATLFFQYQEAQKIKSIAPAFPAACILLQSWAEERCLLCTTHQTKQFLVSILLFLLTGPQTSKKGRGILPLGGNAWMLFRGTIDFLSRHNFATSPIFMELDRLGSSKFDLDHFHTSSSAVFVGPTGFTNLLHGCTDNLLALIRFESNLTIKALEEENEDAFRDVFRSFSSLKHLRFDASASASIIPSKFVKYKSSSTSEPNRIVQLVNDLQQVLAQALGDRIKAFVVMISPVAAWPTSSAFITSTLNINIGLYLDQSEAGRLVDHGPAAENEEACREWRTFWGDKSDVRRFKDGRIMESVVWEAETPLARAHIVGQIIQHILKRHFNLDNESLQVFAGVFNDVISESITTRKALYQEDPSVRSFGGIMTAYEQLGAALRGLQGLPLALKNVTASSEQLRYTSVFVPGARKTKQFSSLSTSASFVPTADIIMTFETSGHWPDHLEAVQKIKAALLQRVGDLICQELAHSQCNLAFDLEASPQSDNVALEIILSSGYAFRAQVHHEREKTLLSQLPITTPEELASVQAMLRQHTMRFVTKPKHHAATSTLQHALPILGTSIRIVKRWLRSHLLSPHLAPELIELLCVAAFLDPYSCLPIPASSNSGFARVLMLLAHWTWRTKPLLVSLYTAASGDLDLPGGARAKFPADKAIQARQFFEESRKNDPHLSRGGTMCIITEEDLTGKIWSQNLPPLIAARITSLASATLETLGANLASLTFDHRTLFQTPMNHFDFIVRLKPGRLTRCHEAILPDQNLLSVRNSTSHLASQMPVPSIQLNFDTGPALVSELQKLLGDAVVFFHDLHGGTVIAGLFNPDVGKAREWHVSPVMLDVELVKLEGKKKRKVKLDRKAVLDSILRLGGSYIQSIEVK